MIHTFAVFYVNYLEPALKVLAVILAVAFVLYLFNLLRGGDRKNDIVSIVVNGTIKLIVKTISLFGKLIAKTFKMLLETIRIIFATLRDFLTSKI